MLTQCRSQWGKWRSSSARSGRRHRSGGSRTHAVREPRPSLDGMEGGASANGAAAAAGEAQHEAVTTPGASLPAASPPASPGALGGGAAARRAEGDTALVAFSGGTAFNGVVKSLKQWTHTVAHVLPVSDDGGSTAEIVRVLGGPAVGDIRSRCLRLSDDATTEARAVRALLGHRLPRESGEARLEWYEIVEGRSPLWDGVSAPYKHTIRSFLVHFHSQILRHATEHFEFANGSIGNFFFAGARIFFRSLDAAIFLYCRVSGIPPETEVLPVTSANNILTLGAELENGTLVRGQSEISHPATHSTIVDKSSGDALPSPVRRVLYLSTEGDDAQGLHEVFPSVNEGVISSLLGADAVVYGIGSLYTSICPCLILQGVGEAIAERNCAKVLMLNGAYDRETDGMKASDVVAAITSALNRQHTRGQVPALDHSPGDYVTALIAPEDGELRVDRKKLERMGVRNIVTVRARDGYYDPDALVNALKGVVALQKAV